MIRITGEYITLGQFLKKTAWIQSGGEAKSALNTLHVTVNGMEENRRGRKLFRGDVVCIEDKRYTLQ